MERDIPYLAQNGIFQLWSERNLLKFSRSAKLGYITLRQKLGTLLSGQRWVSYVPANVG